jgi:hypothetical protein
MSDTHQLDVGLPGSNTVAPIEAPLASKPVNESSTQLEEDEIEVDLRVEGNSGTNSLKRRALSPPAESGKSSRKRLKEDHSQEIIGIGGCTVSAIDGRALAEDLSQELDCGCCSALVYKPVTVHPCQHFFCGRYVISWSSCPRSAC